MAYGFDETTSVGGGNYVDAAGIYSAHIHNVEFGSLKADGGGAPLLMFNFMTEDGKSYRHVEWDIDENREKSQAAANYKTLVGKGNPPKDRSGKLLNEAQYIAQQVQRAYENQGGRIKHIAMAYGLGNQKVGGNTYAEFSKNVCDLFNSADTSENKNLLVVYNNKNYLKLPAYAPFFVADRAELEAKIAAKPASYKMQKTQSDEESGYGPTGSEDSSGADGW